MSAGYRKAIQKMKCDTTMRDVREVKAEVRANKAAIDKQERERPQAMAVDEPKNVGAASERS